jgi:hypothetical protein
MADSSPSTDELLIMNLAVLGGEKPEFPTTQEELEKEIMFARAALYACSSGFDIQALRIREKLNVLLGEDGLIPSNFNERYEDIEDVFHYFLNKGLRGLFATLYRGYLTELVQAGFPRQTPSEGRIGYIKQYLEILRKIIEGYISSYEQNFGYRR